MRPEAISVRGLKLLVYEVLNTGWRVYEALSSCATSVLCLDGKTGLLTGLMTGKQGWKCPVSLVVTCCGSKLLKVILIDADFGYYPLLNPLVTL